MNNQGLSRELLQNLFACYPSAYDKVLTYTTLLLFLGKIVTSVIRSLWQSRTLSLAILLISIIVFSYLFFSPQSLPSDIPHTDKYGHIIVFFCLSMLIYKCINIARRYQIAILVSYGIGVECIQYFIPYRSGGLDDVAADAIGVVLFYALTMLPTCRKLFDKP